MPPPALPPSSLLLCGSWFNPYCMRVLIALSIKQVPFHMHEVSQEEQYNHKPQWLLDLNPEGKVPFLLVPTPDSSDSSSSPASSSSSSSSSGPAGSRARCYAAVAPHGELAAAGRSSYAVIRESLAINEFLEEAFPTPSLMPPDPVGRAAARLLIKRVDEGLAPAIKNVLATPHSMPEAAQAEAAAALDAEMSWMLQHFEPHGPFALSDQLSLVDCALGPHLIRLPLMRFYCGYKYSGPHEGRLAAYRSALRRHAAVRASMYHPGGEEFMSALKRMYAHYAVSMIYSGAPLW